MQSGRGNDEPSFLKSVEDHLLVSCHSGTIPCCVRVCVLYSETLIGKQSLRVSSELKLILEFLFEISHALTTAYQRFTWSAEKLNQISID